MRAPKKPPTPDFDLSTDVNYGAAEAVSPLVSRIVAQNPGPFSFTGTGTFIIGTSDLAVIDPGPLDEAHLAALMRAVADRPVRAVLVTHTHLDHSPLSRRFAEMTGAKIHAYGRHGEGRAAGLAGESVEAGADLDFAPDIRMGEGDTVTGNGWTIAAVHTPGHTSNHLCFDLREEQTLFTGDHVMGWSTTIVSPPDGDMAAYMRSLDKLTKRHDKLYRPTHGAPVTKNPQRFARALLGHRRQREQQILECIREGVTTIDAMVTRMYAAIDPRLHPAAARSVLSHLIMMTEDGRVTVEGAPGLGAVYRGMDK